jgi:hypothetical protein
MEKLVGSDEIGSMDDVKSEDERFWLNVDFPTGLAKLHRSSCRHCTPGQGLYKEVNKIGKNGGWFSFSTPEEAKKYYNENESDMIWQPCKVCYPYQRID